MGSEIDKLAEKIVDELSRRGACSIGIQRDDHTKEHLWVKGKMKSEEIITNNKWKIYTALLITLITWLASIVFPLFNHFSER